MSKRYVFDMNISASFNDEHQIVVYVNDDEDINEARAVAHNAYEQIIFEELWDYVDIETDSMDNKEYDIDDYDAREVVDNRSDTDEPVKRMFDDEIAEENRLVTNRRIEEQARRKQSEVMTAIASTWD